MAVTRFGKELRKLRIENDLILKNMADDLGVSVAMLSAIELGNRKIPKDMVEDIVDCYNLDSEYADVLYAAAVDSEESIEFNLQNAGNTESLFLKAFARELRQGVDENKMKELLRVMREES